MPPGMPEKILWSRRETADWRAFQVRVEFIDDDECLCSLSALLDDEQRVAAVEKHGTHHSDVEISDGFRQIVSVAIVHFLFGFHGCVTKPV